MSKVNCGDIFQSNNYGEFIIIEKYKYGKFKIKFLLTEFEKITTYASIVNREVRDPYFPIYYEVACIGDIDYRKYPHEFSTWRGIINRCYDKNHRDYRNYGGNNVTICNKWLCFENFHYDISYIKGYNEELFLSGKLQIDKDIYSDKNNPMYSLETCIFLTPKENYDERNSRNKRYTSSRYIGVSKLYDGKWQSSISYRSRNIYIGRYDTEEKAHNAYINKHKELFSDENVSN